MPASPPAAASRWHLVLAAPTPRPLTTMESRHPGRFGAVRLGGIDRKGSRPSATTGSCRSALSPAGAGPRRPSAPARRPYRLSQCHQRGNDKVLALAAGAVDDGDGLLIRGRALFGGGFRAPSRAGGSARGFFRTGRGLTQHDPRRRLAAERIVAKERDSRQRRPETGQAPRPAPADAVNGSRKRRFLRTGFLSERRAQLVGRFRHEPPKSTA